jgi:ABC-type cobalamin/Fe3+-siderophores transport system ATPase subunit
VTLRATGLVVGPLHGVDLALLPGLTVLVGDAECGASTLLRVLAGQQIPDAGSVVGGPCALLGAPPGEEWERDDIVVAALAAPHLIGREMGSMSSGERQRVRLAAVLADSSPVLLLDEPLGYLDEVSLRLVLRTLKEDGRPVLVVCKADPRAGEAADRVVTLVEGRLREVRA